jgi:mono/diheme cytochrome c family protein
MRCALNLTTSRIAVLAACSLAVPFALASAQNSTPVTGLTSNPIYEKDCAKCHGKTAGGRRFGGPSLMSIKVASASDDGLRNIIANGKGHMPKYEGKLSAEEIDTLVHEIRGLNPK